MPALSSDGLHVEHGLLGRLQHGIEAAQHGHRQDDVAVLAADVEVAQHVVGDAPDEVGDPVQLRSFHRCTGSDCMPRGLMSRTRSHRKGLPQGTARRKDGNTWGRSPPIYILSVGSLMRESSCK